MLLKFWKQKERKKSACVYIERLYYFWFQNWKIACQQTVFASGKMIFEKEEVRRGKLNKGFFWWTNKQTFEQSEL